VSDPDRRRFLTIATCGVGAGVGLGIVAPVTRLVLAPASRDTVSVPTEPMDAGDATKFRVGADPRRVDLIAPVVKDAWSAAHDVLIGSAWVRRVGDDKLEAFSAVCPHLGCAVGWDATQKNFLCPCHDSRFEAGGNRMKGPAERGLDPLPIEIKDGRLRLTWLRFRMGGTSREPT
jgi:menaquinol-cytochrome c reductase iron-sulfur subunit